MTKPKTSLYHLPLLICIVSVLALSACNTIKGAGRDIEATGDAIEGAAEDTQNDL